MHTSEPGDRRVVGDFFPLEQKHKIDVPTTACLEFSARVDAVHLTLDCKLEHLLWRRLVFSDPFVRFIQTAQIHFFNKTA